MLLLLLLLVMMLYTHPSADAENQQEFSSRRSRRRAVKKKKEKEKNRTRRSIALVEAGRSWKDGHSSGPIGRSHATKTHAFTNRIEKKRIKKKKTKGPHAVLHEGALQWADRNHSRTHFDWEAAGHCNAGYSIWTYTTINTPKTKYKYKRQSQLDNIVRSIE